MKKEFIKWIILSILFSALLEVILFNYRSIESLGFREVEDFSIQEQEDENGRYIELDQLDCPVNNMFLNISSTDEGIDLSEYTVQLSAMDEGNAVYNELPEITIKNWKETGRYIKLNLSGNAKKIKITFPDMERAEKETLQVQQIRLNAFRPFQIEWGRILGITGILLIWYWVRPSSDLYQKTYDLRKKGHQSAIILWLGLQIALVLFVSFDNPRYVNPTWEHHYQYEELAQSLAEGHFYLNIEPSEELKAMENPYDEALRKQQQVPYHWDHAYYQGKYYVYFGIVPVLAFYLPFYLITGSGYPNILAIIFCEIAFIYGLMALLHAIVRRYFPKTSLGMVLMLDMLTFFGCGGLIIAKNCTFYILPVVMALCFMVWGLYFWVTAEKEGKVCWKRVFWGSLFMALIAGCRPQILLSSFLGIPILGKSVCQALRQKGERKKVCMALFPYVAVGGFLMYYNYARFGSPFDFGSNYNLTTNDMTKRGFHLDRLPFGMFSFFLQPPSFSAQFPFMESVHMLTTYQGTTIHEKMYGGILMLQPILWSNVLCVRLKKQLKEKKLWTFAVLSLCSALLIAAADVQMAGILVRYMCDFGIFLCLPMIFILLQLEEENIGNKLLPVLQKVIGIAAVVTAGMGFLWIWA